MVWSLCVFFCPEEVAVWSTGLCALEKQHLVALIASLLLVVRPGSPSSFFAPNCEWADWVVLVCVGNREQVVLRAACHEPRRRIPRGFDSKESRLSKSLGEEKALGRITLQLLL